MSWRFKSRLCRSALQVCALWLCMMPASADETAIVLPAVDVTALFDALAEQRLASGQKLIIDADEIRSLGGLSVAEVLRKLPGLDRSGSGAAAGASANARGIGRDSVTILVNGERPTASGRHALTMVGRLPAEELERIELLRGASAEFGAGSEVVVNLILKPPRREWSTNLRWVAGMRGDEPNLQFSAGVGGGRDAFAWNLPLAANRHRMPVSRNRTFSGPGGASGDRLDGVYRVDEAMLTPRLSWAEGGRKLTLWPSLYHNTLQRDQTLSLHDAAGNPAGERHDRERGGYEIARLRIDAETQVADDGKLTLRFATMDGSRDSRTTRSLRPLTGPVSEVLEALNRDEREINGSARLDRPVGDTHLLSLGLEGAQLDRRERQRFDLLRVHQRQRERQWSAWIQDEWFASERLSLTYGVRYEGIEQHTAALARRDRVLDPSVAMRWEVNESWVLRASAGSGVRFPKLDELTALVTRNADGASSPLQPDEAGLPGLEVERIRRAEVSAERYFADERGMVGATMYARQTRDFVETRVRNEGGRWVARPDNVGSARHWGLEFQARLDTALLGAWGEGGMLRASLTLPRSRVDDRLLDTRRVANDTPRQQMSMSWDVSPTDAATGFGVQIRHTGASRTEMGALQRERKAALTRVDAHVTRRLSDGVNLRLSAENLFGRAERTVREARHGGQHWRIASREGGERTWLVSLDGKW